ncbi:class I SAM-dependent methyltransferase [Cryobacterium tepidiphilum]|uniref:Class I SAM-dependent methyltransferase n=1 Tax=Cryobacterium tepidiphilum TaxID=2486026 RepID=A0A3M8LPW1_9MICO|nr:class I SAM-dependent methyltransferase [Cryobacterium tepidiphilum]RNE66764.1 class I SAM-dependent methyltransferase [Cryobacterium tepidiphilum]
MTHHHDGDPQAHHHDSGLAELLDLDAEALGTYLDDVTAWVARYATDAPRLVVDIGAGTGTGSLALARRFPGADVVAIDAASSMLQRVVASARSRGLDDRVRAVQADLDIRWPDVTGVDIAWASSSVHELADPGRLFRDVFAALTPGGLLAVIEMDAQPSFLGADPASAGLESRLHEAMAQAGWNAHQDWRPLLEAAGFEIKAEHRFTIDVNGAAPATLRYAGSYLRNARSALDQQLSTDDAAALDHLLADGNLEVLLGSSDATTRVVRSAWAARRPA